MCSAARSSAAEPVTLLEKHKAVLAKSCARDKPDGFDNQDKNYRNVVRNTLLKGEEERLIRINYATQDLPEQAVDARLEELNLCRGFYLPRLALLQDVPANLKRPMRRGFAGMMGPTSISDDNRQLTVLQVTGPHSILVKRDGKTLFVKGFSTEGLVDGDALKIDFLVWIAGTHQYTDTSGATRTVQRIEPFPMDWRTWHELA